MKTITFSTLLLVIVIATSSFVISNQHITKEASAQGKPGNTLRIHRQGKGIALAWGASGRASEFMIQRSGDGGEFFDDVAIVPCTGASNYKYIDYEFFPGDIAYRVITILSDGSQEVSAVASIRYVQRK
jgi:hypothetical protein